MKGTLFSADFVKDGNGNLRLLELNTDTGLTEVSAPKLDFSGFISVVSGSNINEVHVIYKQFQEPIVSALSQSLADSGLGISFHKSLEELQTIYPSVITDAENKFILRLAYDESAIFDSTYCKDKGEVFRLFHDNNEQSAVPEFFLSSSAATYDNLRKEANGPNLPDLAVKNINNVRGSISFFKVPGTGSAIENFDAFLEGLEQDRLVVNYYETAGESSQRSIRSMNIIYGANLDLINLGNFDGAAVFEKPTTLQVDSDGFVNTRHYYELTTNYPIFKPENSYGGIFQEEEITGIDGNPVPVVSASIGEAYKSYFISGSPDTDSIIGFTSWTHEGSEVPSGSYVTSSVLVNKVETPLYRNIISHVQTDDSASFRATGNQHVLVYDSGSNLLRFKSLYEIDPTSDSLLKLDGTLTGVATNDIEVLDGDYSTYLLDFEEVDTYILHESGLNLKVVAHNACFPAGTEILLTNGDVKYIENIQPGDEVVSYDIDKKTPTSGRVSALHSSVAEELIHITAESGLEVKCTLGHRIYSTKGWRDAKDLQVGDLLIDAEGKEVAILSKELIEGAVKVYHIMNVGSDHTYFANGILVHNWSTLSPSCFVAGTKITLADGTEKNIEDVAAGEEVLSLNEESKKKEAGVVGQIKKHEVSSVVRLTFDNSIVITTTEEHPFYVDGKGWVEASKLQELDNCVYVDGNLALISTVEKLQESHTVYNLLNVGENHTFYANKVLVHNKMV